MTAKAVFLFWRVTLRQRKFVLVRVETTFSDFPRPRNNQMLYKWWFDVISPNKSEHLVTFQIISFSLMIQIYIQPLAKVSISFKLFNTRGHFGLADDFSKNKNSSKTILQYWIVCLYFQSWKHSCQRKYCSNWAIFSFGNNVFKCRLLHWRLYTSLGVEELKVKQDSLCPINHLRRQLEYMLPREYHSFKSAITSTLQHTRTDVVDTL